MTQILWENSCKISSLEVKNALYDVFLNNGNPIIQHLPLNDSFSISQSEVSMYMQELYVEHNWNRQLNKVNNTFAFYEYSLPVNMSIPVNSLSAIITTDPNDFFVINNGNDFQVGKSYTEEDKNLIDDFLQQQLDLKNSNSKVNNIIIPNQTKLDKLDINNGGKVCFITKKPQLFVQGNDMKEIRRECFQKYNDTEIGLTYDDISRYSVEHYNNKFC